MTTQHRLAFATLAACLLATACVEDSVMDSMDAAASTQPPEVASPALERRQSAPILQAEVSPPSTLCMSAQRRTALTGEVYWAERDFAHAQQADGGQWQIACQYRDSF